MGSLAREGCRPPAARSVSSQPPPAQITGSQTARAARRLVASRRKSRPAQATQIARLSATRSSAGHECASTTPPTPASALRLPDGKTLDVAQASSSHVHHVAAIGFHLAERLIDAHVLGSYRTTYSIMKIDMDRNAFQRLLTAGAVRRPIPGRSPPFFKGRELFVTPAVFSLFDHLRSTGEIHVHT